MSKADDMNIIKDTYAVGGVDLSSTSDLTCATILIFKRGFKYVVQQYFIPRSNEMFGKMGYEKEIVYIFYVSDSAFYIVFHLDIKDFEIFEMYNDGFLTRSISIDDTSPEVAKAINEKCKELGWI